MKFYIFNQNNSGGSFHHDSIAGIGYDVCIEAENAKEANIKAESIGLYFNGCENDIDCGCCGDRWHRVSDAGSQDDPDDCRGGCGISGYIHYNNGTIKKVEDK